MWVWVDHLSGLVLDASVSAFVLFALVGLAVLGTRQPARRLRLARAGVIGSLTLIPLIRLRLVPTFHLMAAGYSPGVLPPPLLSPRWGPFPPPPGLSAGSR